MKRKHKQNINYVFFVKNFMEKLLSQGVDQSDIQDKFEEAIKELNDRQLQNLLVVTGNIPDMYEENGSEEKLYTKLIEIVTKEAFCRITNGAHCVKQKSSYQDVTIETGDKIVVCDCKCFRLSRSQAAPNPKDFIKATDYEMWLSRFDKNKRLGGIVVYPCVHEWSSASESYRVATNYKLPIVALPYKYLAYLLKYKARFTKEEFANLWNYRNIFPKQSNSKEHYWKYMGRQIKYLTRTNDEEFDRFNEAARSLINRSIYQHKTAFEKFANLQMKKQKEEILAMSLEELRETLIKEKCKDYVRQTEKIEMRMN